MLPISAWENPKIHRHYRFIEDKSCHDNIISYGQR